MRAIIFLVISIVNLCADEKITTAVTLHQHNANPGMTAENMDGPQVASNGTVKTNGSATKQRNMCKEPNADVKRSYQLNAAGKAHCLFAPTKQDEVVKKKPQGDGYDFSVNDARAYCQKLQARLLQIPNEIMHTILVHKGKQSENVYHPLGIKRMTKQDVKKEIDRPDILELTVKVTWDSGRSTEIDTLNTFGMQFSAWSRAETNDVAFIKPRMAMIISISDPENYPSIAIMCHQRMDDSPSKDICGGVDSSVTEMALLNAGGVLHCVFHHPSGNRILRDRMFDLDVLRNACRTYDAGLLELENKEFFEALVTEAKKKDWGHLYPLGIKEKEIIRGTVPPPPVQEHNINVTWEDGSVMFVSQSKVYGEIPWVQESENGTAFLNLPNGSFYFEDPANLQGDLVVLCHQEVPLTTQTFKPTISSIKTSHSIQISHSVQTSHAIQGTSSRRTATTENGQTMPTKTGPTKITVPPPIPTTSTKEPRLLQASTTSGSAGGKECSVNMPQWAVALGAAVMLGWNKQYWE